MRQCNAMYQAWNERPLSLLLLLLSPAYVLSGSYFATGRPLFLPADCWHPVDAEWSGTASYSTEPRHTQTRTSRRPL